MKFIITILVAGLVSSYWFVFKATSSPSIQRIVALSPAHSQFIKYLELTEKLIAISSFDTDPLMQNKQKISGGVTVQEEEILKLNPDLVLIGDLQNSSEYTEFLDSYQIPSLVLETKSLQNIKDSLSDLQKLFPDTADLVSRYQQEYDTIKQTVPKNRRKAFVIIAIDPIYSISTNDYLSEVYQCSGWDSVVHTKSPYPIISEEYLLSLGKVDDIIISAFLTNELAYISNIQKKIQAENILVITNRGIELPSPYLLEIIKELRILQSSL
ncbi:MAG: ABC transporter substrate-binding protein [Brevinema sp.]